MTDKNHVELPKPEDTAIEFCCQGCFHQSIWLPATPRHNRLRVTFATTNNTEMDKTKKLPTALFCTPMGASRLMIYDLNYVAVQAGVRLIFIDRPGFGGSTPVALDQRIEVWIESVSAVLEKLQCVYVSLISHSAGTIYLLNTLIQLPGILHPVRPFAATLAPWVHPEQSSAKLMKVVDKLPQSWIGNFHHIHNLIGDSVVTPMQFSSGLLDYFATSTRTESDSTETKRFYGYEKEVWDEISRCQRRYSRTEDNSGVSEEALLCMKKGEARWGVFNDYPSYLQRLKQQYTAPANPSQKLIFRASFAESDIMIGSGGQNYVGHCWESEIQDKAIDFSATVVTGTNHDSIVLPSKEYIGELLGEVKSAMD